MNKNNRSVIKWQFDTKMKLNSSIAISRDLVYSSGEKILYALDTNTGIENWRFKPKNSTLIYAPVLSDGIIYCGSVNFLYSLDSKTGKEKWNFKTEDCTFDYQPFISDRLVYFHDKHHLYSLDSETGKEQWKVESNDIGHGFPHLLKGTYKGLVYLRHSEYLLAINGRTGENIWKWEFKSESYISYVPAISDGIIYIGDSDKYLYAVDSRTGTEVWKFQTVGGKVCSSPNISEGIVYFGSTDNHLYGVDSKTGTGVWKFQDNVDGAFVSSPNISEGIVYFGSIDNHLYAVDSKTGTEVWKFECSDFINDRSIYLLGFWRLVPAILDQVVFYPSQDGTIYAVDIQIAKNLLSTNQKGDQLREFSQKEKDEITKIKIDELIKRLTASVEENMSWIFKDIFHKSDIILMDHIKVYISLSHGIYSLQEIENKIFNGLQSLQNWYNNDLLFLDDYEGEIGIDEALEQYGETRFKEDWKMVELNEEWKFHYYELTD